MKTFVSPYLQSNNFLCFNSLNKVTITHTSCKPHLVSKEGWSIVG